MDLYRELRQAGRQLARERAVAPFRTANAEGSRTANAEGARTTNAEGAGATNAESARTATGDSRTSLRTAGQRVTNS